MAESLDVIILAAGIGARIQSPGNNLPKCLLSIDSEQTILSRQVTQFLEAANVNRIIVATGFEHDHIEEYLPVDPSFYGHDACFAVRVTGRGLQAAGRGIGGPVLV